MKSSFPKSVDQFYALLQVWNTFAGKPFTEARYREMQRVSREASALQAMGSNFYLKHLQYSANVYTNLPCKFPSTTGYVSVEQSMSVQYLTLFEAWQKEMSGQQCREWLIQISQAAEVIKAMCPVEISEVTLPDEPLYNKHKYLAFPKPSKLPTRLSVDIEQTKAFVTSQRPQTNG